MPDSPGDVYNEFWNRLAGSGAPPDESPAGLLLRAASVAAGLLPAGRHRLLLFDGEPGTGPPGAAFESAPSGTSPAPPPPPSLRPPPGWLSRPPRRDPLDAAALPPDWKRWLGIGPGDDAAVLPLLADDRLAGAWCLVSPAGDPAFRGSVRAAQGLGPPLGMALHRQLLLLERRDGLRRAEEQDRFATMGKLLAGFAHDLGTPLQAIMSLSELLERRPERIDATTAARRIARSALRCRSMIQDLLGFAQAQPFRMECVPVTGAVLDAMELERFSGSGGPPIALDAPDTPVYASASGQRLTQVLVNLLANARQAIAERGGAGSIRIAVTRHPPQASGPDRVSISVEDDGPGIPPGAASRIFESGFTTKPRGAGSGFGLAISRNLVEGMGGRLEYDAGHSPGARFVVTLAAADAPSPVQTADGSGPPGAAGGRRVLVIDDDEELLESYAAILALDGFHAMTAGKAREALDILAHESVDAIVCDYHLPDMAAPEFHEEVRRRFPACLPRIVYASGDAIDPRVRTFLSSLATPHLLKPFLAEDLVSAILAVSGGRP